MPAPAPLPPVEGRPPAPARDWRVEALGIVTLLALAVFFIATSWRKWTDPLADAGPQLHTFWRVSQGAHLYHDVTWNYGPLAPTLGALLFKIFGPGVTVIATANLFIYALILAVAYVAFRRAWGPLGAFAALAVFVSVFSFSRLNSIANYNYATPYADEATLGILLVLVTALVGTYWCRGPSWRVAAVLGFCGGLATVLKPEFMLAGGAIGLLAMLVKWRQHEPPSPLEFLAALAALALPTLLFAGWFARYEPASSAFIDASKAWWLVLIDHSQATTTQQQLFLGLNRPWPLALAELQAAALSLAAIAVIWTAGWAMNRTWTDLAKALFILAAGVLVYCFRPQPDWRYAGSSFPGLMVVLLVVLAFRFWRQTRNSQRADEPSLMALMLALLGAAMLARMPLHARIGHLGFYQAALAGMVITAFMITVLPTWTGPARLGRWLTAGGSAVAIGIGCASVAFYSHAALADQTFPVGAGRDRFYTTAPDLDSSGQLVNWVVDFLKSTPPEATVCVLPEGEMINYLSRRPDPLKAARSESEIIDRLNLTRPDYVVFISRDLSEGGVTEYGAPGGPGYPVKRWLIENRYAPTAASGGNPLISATAPGAVRGAVILKKPADSIGH